MALASSNLFGNSKLYERLHDFLNCNLSVLFLCGCQSTKLLSTSSESCSQSAFFFGTTTSALNVDFTAFVGFDDLCYAGDCSQLSWFSCSLRGRTNSFSWETVAPQKILLFRTFLSVIEVDDLLEELGRNCVVVQDAPVRVC